MVNAAVWLLPATAAAPRVGLREVQPPVISEWGHRVTVAFLVRGLIE